ncbi:DUF916 and DUF3324 domain-containing protein [Lacticaseibacillus sp. GG6-2]
MYKRLISLVVMIAVALGFAAINPVQATGSSFSLTPTLTDAASKDAGYFNIIAKPGQKVTFGATLTNLTDATKRVKVAVANAYTSNNGQVMYDPAGPRDSSAQYRLSALAGKGSTITLPPKASRHISYPVTVPKTGIHGELLGSLHAVDVSTYGKATQGNLTIRNKFAAFSTIILRTNNAYVSPDLKMPKLKIGMQAGHAAMLATLQNVEPQLFGKMRIKAKVYKGNSTKAVMTREVSDYAMAPNSHFKFAVFSGHAFVAGKYTIDLVAKSGTHTWHFRRSLKVSQANANKVNKQANLKVANPFPWWLVALIVLLILIILLLLFLLFKRRKQDRDDAEQDQ